MTWVVARSGRWGRTRLIEVPGRLVDVSITGAAILAPGGLDLEAGANAVVRIHGRDSVVVVRHRELLDDGATDRVGVELPQRPSALRCLVGDLLDPAPGPLPSRTGDEVAHDEVPHDELPDIELPDTPLPHDVVIDLTDATIAAHGGPVLELSSSRRRAFDDVDRPPGD